MLLYVAEFPFHYDNRENADIFEGSLKTQEKGSAPTPLRDRRTAPAYGG
jgi:hypothetical protein